MPLFPESSDGSPGLEPARRGEVSTAHIVLMVFSVGGIVANLYYIQPLLSSIAATFRISVPQVGAVAMLTQLGAALGMLCFVPLGDTHERRKLIVLLVTAEAGFLALMASAQNYLWLAAASFGIGMAASTVHLLVPFAAQLASPARRGAAVGAVLSGLLMGILLARTFSGLLGAAFGWRAIYWIAAGIMLLLAGLIRVGLPRSIPSLSLSWPALLRSSWRLVRTQPVLREAASLSALLFAAFSAFWTTLIFLLESPPYHYGSAVAGLFGLVGASGALCAPFVGRFADKYGARRNVLIAILITLASFIVLWIFGHHIAGLIAGVILLDIGVQSAHVSNQTRIYALNPEARSRLNMVYMVCYFAAGSLGSYFGGLLWHHFAWSGVCALGGTLAITAGAVYLATEGGTAHQTAFPRKLSA
jgi:predicted MFS family arabinose efflux permease